MSGAVRERDGDRRKEGAVMRDTFFLVGLFRIDCQNKLELILESTWTKQSSLLFACYCTTTAIYNTRVETEIEPAIISRCGDGFVFRER